MNNIQNYNFNKNICSDFSWKNITWNWWLLAVWEFINTKINLEKLLEKSIKENWNPKKVKHKKSKIIFQKIYGIIAWYKTNNIDQYIKNDPVFKVLLWEVVPKTSVNRILNSFWDDIKKSLQKTQFIIEKYNIETTNKKNVIVDIDTTFDEASKNIEKSTYNTHYATTGYSPILAFDWLNWDFIKWELRPWNFHCSKESLEFIKNIEEFYEENNVEVIFRMDSWFAIPEIYKHLESKNIKYYIKLKSNSVLKDKAELLADIKNATPWKNIWVEFQYSAGSWEKERRIICSIDWINIETEESKKNNNENKQYSLIPFYSFIVTNDLEYTKQEVFSMYNWRATIETLIEEAKNWFMMDRLSHSDFSVNSAVFQIHLLTIQIFQLFRKMTSWEKRKVKENKVYTNKDYDGKFEWIKKIWRKEYSLFTIQTFRLILFSIPAVIVKTWRKLLFRFEKTFWWKDLYNDIMLKLNNLPSLRLTS
jgi:hypothetical protein